MLSNWIHFAVTFDYTKLQLFLNGNLAIPPGTPGPLGEHGGFVIGGNRSGTSRNFDGMIDEVALLSRVLTSAEITTLYNN